jgi:hypothetical protein
MLKGKKNAMIPINNSLPTYSSFLNALLTCHLCYNTLTKYYGLKTTIFLLLIENQYQLIHKLYHTIHKKKLYLKLI